MNIVVEVIEIKGNCPVYSEGDKFYLIDGYKLEGRKPVCMHSLSSIMPYYNAISKGVNFEDLDLGGREEAYVQCLDPVDLTGGGTVKFRIYREND